MLEKDIGLERETISKLSRALREGKPMEEWGVTPHSDSDGYVNHEIVDKKSDTYQALLELLESNQWQAFKDRMYIAGGGILTGNKNRPRAMVEKERSEWVLKEMARAYDKFCRE